MHMAAIATILSAALAVPDQPRTTTPLALAALRSACAVDFGSGSRLPGLEITSSKDAAWDLPYTQARSTSSGAVVRIYYDKGLKVAANSKIACLGGMSDMLREVTRYGAALAVFDGLQQRHGRAAVQKGLFAMLSRSKDDTIATIGEKLLGEGISSLLS